MESLTATHIADSGNIALTMINVFTSLVVGGILVPFMAYNIGYRLLFRQHAGHIHQHPNAPLNNDIATHVAVYMNQDYVELIRQQFVFNVHEMHQIITILITHGMY